MSRSWTNRLLAASVSTFILVLLYRLVDPALVVRVLRQADPVALSAVVGLIVPMTMVRAFRFLVIAPPGALPGYGEALRLTLSAAALNVFMPAKSGDLLKSYRLATQSGVTAGVSLSVAVYERFGDLLGLATWSGLAGLAAVRMLPAELRAPVPVILAIAAALMVWMLSVRLASTLQRSAKRWLPWSWLAPVHRLAGGWPALLEALQGRRLTTVLLSLAMWLVSLSQVWMMARVVGIQLPFATCVYVSSFAILAGQVPFTLAGVGTRDAVFVIALRSDASPEQAAALGLLTATRVLIPALAGLAFLRRYVADFVSQSRSADA